MTWRSQLGSRCSELWSSRVDLHDLLLIVEDLPLVAVELMLGVRSTRVGLGGFRVRGLESRVVIGGSGYRVVESRLCARDFRLRIVEWCFRGPSTRLAARNSTLDARGWGSGAADSRVLARPFY